MCVGRKERPVDCAFHGNGGSENEEHGHMDDGEDHLHVGDGVETEEAEKYESRKGSMCPLIDG